MDNNSEFIRLSPERDNDNDDRPLYKKRKRRNEYDSDDSDSEWRSHWSRDSSIHEVARSHKLMKTKHSPHNEDKDTSQYIRFRGKREEAEDEEDIGGEEVLSFCSSANEFRPISRLNDLGVQHQDTETPLTQDMDPIYHMLFSQQKKKKQMELKKKQEKKDTNAQLQAGLAALRESETEQNDNDGNGPNLLLENALPPFVEYMQPTPMSEAEFAEAATDYEIYLYPCHRFYSSFNNYYPDSSGSDDNLLDTDKTHESTDAQNENSNQKMNNSVCSFYVTKPFNLIQKDQKRAERWLEDGVSEHDSDCEICKYEIDPPDSTNQDTIAPHVKQFYNFYHRYKGYGRIDLVFEQMAEFWNEEVHKKFSEINIPTPKLSRSMIEKHFMHSPKLAEYINLLQYQDIVHESIISLANYSLFVKSENTAVRGPIRPIEKSVNMLIKLLRCNAELSEQINTKGILDTLMHGAETRIGSVGLRQSIRQLQKAVASGIGLKGMNATGRKYAVLK